MHTAIEDLIQLSIIASENRMVIKVKAHRAVEQAPNVLKKSRL